MKTFIVVGGGILGAATAYHLAKAGTEVTIIDRRDQGQATDAAAGIVCPWLSQRRNKAWYTLAKRGAKYYPSLIKELEKDGEADTGYARVGVVGLHSDLKKLDKMEERVQKRKEDAPEIGEVSRLSAFETKKLFPLLSDDFYSIHVSGAARVNGRALRDALISGAKKHGANFLHASAELAFEDNHVNGVKVEGSTLYANQVIIASGAWSKEILKPLGIDFLVEPQKAQIMHLELQEVKTTTWPVVMPPSNQYLIAFEDGRFVAGSTHEDGVGFDNRVTAAGVHEILDKTFTFAPGLVNSTVLETRVGFRPYTPGFLPVIGAVPNYEGILVANGLGASGLTIGPYLGRELAKLALGQELEIDLDLYDVAHAIEKIDT
ncbi:FAD-dependent oxidoreductase [Halalkalibacterium ligniniphilum]|uniref:FAD-dependent oxidoreductase n=1 Tax=Halalkalibacterium ligniniphilum TaxID=1134413 RepID=UPI000344BAD2